MEGEGRDGYRNQIVTCDVGVSLHACLVRRDTDMWAYNTGSLYSATRSMYIAKKQFSPRHLHPT